MLRLFRARAAASVAAARRSSARGTTHAGVLPGRATARATACAASALEPRLLLAATPVAVYHFDEGIGLIAADAAGTNDGTLAGDRLPAWQTPGRIGAADLLFDGDGLYKGTGSRVDAANPLSPVLGGTASLAAWIKTTKVGNSPFWASPSITGVEQTSGQDDVFWGNLEPDGTISVRKGNGPAATSVTPINDGAWHHVAFTRNAVTGEENTYVDGVLEGSTFGFTGVAHSEFRAIGATTVVAVDGHTITGYNYFDGEIDDVSIGDRVWSAGEVAALAAGTPVAVPNAPTDLAVSAVGPFSVTLGWTSHSTNEGGFQIERSPSGAAGTFETVAVAPAGSTSYTDGGLLPDSHYVYRVLAVSVGGASDPTSTVEATTSSDPLSAGPDGFGYRTTGGALLNINLVAGAPGVVDMLHSTQLFDYHSIDLGANTFDFYGQTYSGDTSLYVNTAGLISFTTPDFYYPGYDLGFAPYEPVIAPLWDNWATLYNADAAVLSKLQDDTGDGKADRLIVQWNLVEHVNGSPSTLTFQAILQLNTNGTAGDITFNYPDLDSGDGHAEGLTASAGIKDWGYQSFAGANRILVSYLGSTGLVKTNKSVLIHWAPDPANTPPTANPGGPYSGVVGTGFYLGGYASSDAQDPYYLLHYQWDLDNDGIFAERGAGATAGDENGLSPFYYVGPPNANGQRSISLRVVDSKGAVSPVASTVVNVTANQPPVADAGGPYTTPGFVPVGVNALGTTDPDDYLFSLQVEWDFDGDGNYGEFVTDNGQELGFFAAYVPTVDGPATRTIGLRITDSAGNQSFDTATVNITPNLPPTASAGGPYTVVEGFYTYLYGYGSFDPDEFIPFERYQWDLDGDGVFGETYWNGGSPGRGDELGPNPQFLANGLALGQTVEVTLRVTDAAGHFDDDTTTVTVTANHAPVADPGPPGGGNYLVTPGNYVYLYGYASYDVDEPLQYYQFQWDFNGNGVFGEFTQYGWEFGPGPSFYAAGLSVGQTVNVTLRVTDSQGLSTDATAAIQIVPGQPPIAEAGPPWYYNATRYNATEGPGGISLDGSTSYDPDGYLVDYQWDLDGDGIFGEAGWNGGTPDRGDEVGPFPFFLTAGLPGNSDYTVSLRVVDNSGDVSPVDTAVVHVNPSVFIGDVPPFMSEGSSVVLRAETVGRNTNDNFGLTFDWQVTRDGQPYLTGDERLLNFLPQDQGNYHFVLTVSNEFGPFGPETHVAEASIHVSNLAPVLDGLSVTPGTLNEGDTVTLTGRYNDAGSLDGHTVSIDWGDGTTSTLDLSAAGNNIPVSAPTEFNGHTYYALLGSNVTWEQAEAFARRYGGHLVAINDGAENAFVTALADAAYGPFVNTWIGLTDQDQEGNFVWSNGDAATYTNWWFGEPNNYGYIPGGEDHVMTNWGDGNADGGTWNDINVGGDGLRRTAAAIIEFDTPPAAITPTFTATHQYLDDSGAGQFKVKVTLTDSDGATAQVRGPVQWAVGDGGNGHFYQATHAAGSFADAETEALALGGYLASITSDAENTFVGLNFARTGYYIGLTDRDAEGIFLWTSGEPVGYTNWQGGQPDNFNGDESFAEINFAGPGYWNDRNGWGPEYAIVEFNQAPAGLQRSDEAYVKVANVAPALSSASSSAQTLATAAPEGATVTLSAAFTDAGTKDTHSISVDWGDGTSSTGTVSELLGAGTASAGHQYAAGGIYTATLTIKDDDGGTVSRVLPVYVIGAGLRNGVLTVIGSGGGDGVTINPSGGKLLLHASFLSADRLFEGVGSIVMLLGGGNDMVTVAGAVTVPVTIDGGAGNDQLNAGNGGSVLIGGPGDDMLIGGSGRDILIGGLGADLLVGNGGDDLLVGGLTRHDADAAALAAIAAEWRRTDRTYALRVAALQNGGGLNGSYVFNSSTLIDDRATDLLSSDSPDLLTGGDGNDWFVSNFAGAGNLDKVTDLQKGEVTNDVA